MTKTRALFAAALLRYNAEDVANLAHIRRKLGV